MIVCNDFVFLHLHKSGGTFVNQLMLRCLPGARMIGYHFPYSRLPEPYRALPALGAVRNPWAYYVSWYHFQHSQPKPNALFMICSDNKKLGFLYTIRNLVTLQDNATRLEALIEAFPDAFVNYGLNLTKACISSIRGSGLGFYSFLYARHYHGAPNLTLIRMENLRAELKTFLDRRLSQPSASAAHFLSTAPALNTSRHGPYQDYYDLDLRNLVAQMDAQLISRHGYAY